MVTQYPVSNGNIIEATDVNSAYYQAALASTLNHKSVDVDDSDTTIIAANASRKTILIQNNGSASVFLGLAGVTTGTGFELENGTSILLHNKETVHAIAAAAGPYDVRYLEVE